MAKFHSKECPECKGKGPSCAWACYTCDNVGRVPLNGKIAKPAKNIWFGYETTYERQAGA